MLYKVNKSITQLKPDDNVIDSQDGKKTSVDSNNFHFVVMTQNKWGKTDFRHTIERSKLKTKTCNIENLVLHI